MTDINERSSFFEKEKTKRKLLRDLRGGEEVLKANSYEYIPQFPLEPKELYEIRVKNSYLYNVVELNIQKLSSKPFNKPATINTKNLFFKSLEFNFDNNDHTLTEFARTWFEDALWDSQSHVFVDMPIMQQRDDGSFVYDPDIRPSAVLINNDDILHARHNGKELTHLRFLSRVTIPDGFDDITLEIVKVFNKTDSGVFWNSYIQDGEDSSDFYKQFDEDQKFGLDYIPLVSLYPLSTMIPFAPKLIFQNMAYIQKAHFKTLSDKRNLEQVVSVPFLHVAGVPADASKQFSLSAFQAFFTEDPASKIGWIEHNGRALGTADKSLAEMVDQMESIGLDLMTRNGGNQTATASTIDQANSNSILSCMAVALKESLEKVVDIYADWMRISDEYSVDITSKFDVTIDANEINFLNNAVAINAISKKDFFNEGKRRGIIDSEITWESTQENMENDIEYLVPDFAPSVNQVTNPTGINVSVESDNEED